MQAFDGTTQRVGREARTVVEKVRAEREIVAEAEEVGGTGHKEGSELMEEGDVQACGKLTCLYVSDSTSYRRSNRSITSIRTGINTSIITSIANDDNTVKCILNIRTWFILLAHPLVRRWIRDDLEFGYYGMCYGVRDRTQTL